MTTPREALTRPFAPEDVQWRPGAAKWDHKPHCEGARCREAKDPAKHMQLAYVEDESVMDRLDEAFGQGYWQLLVEPIAIPDGIVKVRLGVTYDLEAWVWYEDFGYANRQDGDVLKEAVTDGIRRCGRYLGIARDLYRKGATTQGRPVPMSGPVRPAPTPRPVASSPAGGLPEEPEWVAEQIANDAPAPAGRPVSPVVGGECPMHHLPWQLKPGGVSKRSGKPYGPFWACPSTAQPYCNEKPSAKWAAQQEMAS